MEEEPSSEAKELVDSFVALEEEGDECCVVEDVEAPMELDAASEHDVNLEYSESLIGGVVEPTLGMEFTSEDDARNFYNAYAKQTGFSIRVNSYYRSKKHNLIISREFCCSKEGFHRERHGKRIDSGDDMKRRRARPITREGCKALMTVRKRDNGKWFVAKLEKNHNHELATPAMRHFLWSHKQDFDPSKCLSHSCSTVNVLINDSNGFDKLVFTAQNSVNNIGRGRLSTFGIDAQSLLRFFKQSTSVNSLFDGNVNARTTLQDFAEQYEKALDDRCEKEARAEFETFYTKPVLKTPLLMEKQAADIYTRKFFIIFQEEVFESLALAVKFTGEDGGRGTYEVARFDEEHKCFFVCFNIAEQIASCSCKMFEFEGVLC
ncbi:hypothetical protein SO802_002720 [Lithocarpus litseifolius]|uniref:Protein FAR1-RELATED SEQUENCE n=1 Tax=Lithocarpus litseifolius TaxID=425828 RepID=A0AAW2E3P3_9ROSI